MTHTFYRALNPPGMVLTVIVGLAVQTAFFNSYPLLYLQPDVVLLAVVWCGLKRDFYEGGILTLIFANIAEIHSSAPQGIFMMGYMLIYLLIRVIDRYFLVRTLTSIIGLTLCVSILWKLCILGILHLLGESENQWKHTFSLLFPGAVMEGVIGTWIYRWFSRYDWLTFKNPSARKSTGDENYIDREEI